jgi:hypothetical protein
MQRLRGKPEGKKQLEDLVINEMIILNWLIKKWDGIDLAQGKNRWRL